MQSLNKITLIGFLGKDPEIPNSLDTTSDKEMKVIINVATSDSWNDKNTGEKKQHTEWHRVVIYGKLAGIANKLLKKGAQIYIEGKLCHRKWQDEFGQDKYISEIVLNNYVGSFLLLGSRSSELQSQKIEENKENRENFENNNG
ncbi:MAG: single-stranded DNA-binding protein [Gilliamella apicola]|nr:single-stranded DNA-binding protein [Gilliamella apicola]